MEHEEINETQLKEQIRRKISAYIGVPLTPTLFTQMDKSFNGDTIIVDNCPLEEIVELTINNVSLTSDEYVIDSLNGLIYLKNQFAGFLVLKYMCCLSSSQIIQFIDPLVDDMMEYELDVGWTKNASSIKEGDVQINLDTSIGKGALIQKRLDDLKYQFNTYARMI